MSTLTASTAISMAAARYSHDVDHGFCTVCGTVWPCSQAAPGRFPPPVPTPRLATIGAGAQWMAGPEATSPP